ncbi:MAG: hypothetical protein C4342_08440 [Armatimonadota bacterium]
MRVRSGGRLSFVGLVGLVGLLIVLGLGGFFVFGVQTPEQAMQQFMTALAERDIDRLMETSVLDQPSKPLREQWDFCLNVAAKGLPFAWHIGESRQLSDDRAYVEVFTVEFAVGGAKESDEPYRIPLVRHHGKWKVDLTGVPRDFFPSLPR